MASPIRIGANVRSVIDEDGAVLLDLKHGRYFSLNGTGASIWRLLEAGATPAAIEAELACHYATTDGIAHDVAAFVERLRRAELVHAIE